MIGNLNLVVGGKEITIPLELSNETVESLLKAAETEATSHLTGWEMPTEDQDFFYINPWGEVVGIQGGDWYPEDYIPLYEGANCFTSAIVADNIARADLLLRQLRRKAILSLTHPIDFDSAGGYTITYNYQNNCLEVGMTGGWKALGDIIFETEEAARNAMNEHAAELTWYFTEKINRL